MASRTLVSNISPNFLNRSPYNPKFDVSSTRENDFVDF
jgi:hypothetical protein